MAEQKVNVCDPCFAHDTIKEGFDWIFKVQEPGGSEKAFRITLDDEEGGHGELAEDLLEMLETYGTPVMIGTVEDDRKAISPPPVLNPFDDEEGSQQEEEPEEEKKEQPAPSPPPQVFERRIDTVGQRFFQFMESERLARPGVTAMGMAAAVRISRATITQWRDGARNPSIEQVTAITKYLNLDRERVKEITGIDVPPSAGLIPVDKRLSPSNALAQSIPQWAHEVKARCLEVVEKGSGAKCGAEMRRDQMGAHARRVHGVESAAYLEWALIGMPDGTDPVICEDCTLPFPTANQRSRHQMGRCLGKLPEAKPKTSYRSPGSTDRNMVGRTYGNNPVTGSVSHTYNG